MQNHLTALDLCYNLPDGTGLFDSLNFSFGAVRTGLIGQNGIGKTTLLEILSGRRHPSGGTVLSEGRISYLPQAAAPLAGASVGHAIGISHIFESLERIEHGRASVAELAIADSFWEVPEKLVAVFERLGVPHVLIDQGASTLSGGEFMRVRLAGLLLEEPDVILLDEPTNHLDLSARE